MIFIKVSGIQNQDKPLNLVLRIFVKKHIHFVVLYSDNKNKGNYQSMNK